MNYLARYASSEGGLRQILHLRIDSWAREAQDRDTAADLAAAAKAAVPGVVARMVELGLIDDAAFAQSRAAGLARSGRSHRAIAARLVAKGIDPERARAAVADGNGGELAAALILTRKRRIGPFRLTEDGDRNKELGVLARAGFPRDIAIRALDMTPEDAEDTILRARA